jgi:arylformamidase
VRQREAGRAVVELDPAYRHAAGADHRTYGTCETPEFQSQAGDFAAAVKAAGKPVELIEAPNSSRFEMCESLGNPFGPNGLAALKLIKLA